MTRCPDCHSELKIPAPAAKKKQADFKIDPEVANVRLAPVDNSNPRTQIGDSLKTKEILERAEKEAALERKEIEAVAAPFDSQRWLSLIFGFFRDPGVIFLAALLGVCAAMCFAGLHAIGSLELPLIQRVIIQVAVFLCFGIPLLVGILMCCMVILPMAANRRTRVEDWPFGRFGEAIGELVMLAAALFIAALPGSNSIYRRRDLCAPIHMGIHPLIASEHDRKQCDHTAFRLGHIQVFQRQTRFVGSHVFPIRYGDRRAFCFVCNRLRYQPDRYGGIRIALSLGIVLRSQSIWNTRWSH
jgi:hypothetical protein